MNFSGGPSVIRKHFIHILFTGYLDVTIRLLNIDAIEGVEYAFVAKIDTIILTNGANKVTDSFRVNASNG